MGKRSVALKLIGVNRMATLVRIAWLKLCLFDILGVLTQLDLKGWGLAGARLSRLMNHRHFDC